MTPEVTTLIKLETVADLDGAKRFDDQQKKSQRTINSVTKDLAIQERMLKKKGRSYNYVKAHIAGATREELKQILAHEKNIARMQKSEAEMHKQSKTLRMMRGGFGQVGHQIQDVAVQLQGGTDAMIVFGQQGSQIVSLFGPGGAALGALFAVGAALLTSLKPAVDESGESLKEFTDKITEQRKELGLLTQAELDLAAARKASNVNELKQQNIDLQASIDRINVTFKNNEKLLKGLDDGQASAKATAQSMGLSFQDVKDKVEAQRKALLEYNGTLQRNIETIKEAETGAVSKAAADKERLDNIMEMVDAAKKEIKTTGMSERQLAVYEARQKGATVAQLATIDALYKKIEANKAEQKATEEAEKAEKTRQDSINGLIKSAATQATTIGMTKRELDLYKATLQGATEQEIATINALHDAQKVRSDKSAIEGLIQSLKDQTAVIGMTSRELDIYKATLQGATAQEIASINTLHDLSEARQQVTKDIEAQKKAQQELRKAEEDAFTSGLNKILSRIEDKPLAARMAAEEEINIAREAAERGILTEQQYAEAVLAIHMDLHNKLAEIKGTSGQGPERTVVDIGTDFDALIESQKTELELFREHQEAKLALINEYEQTGVDSTRDFAAMRKQIADETAAYEIAARMQTQQQVLGIMSQQVNQLGGMFDQATALGKAFYVAQQGLAAAQAIISGEVASVKILEAHADLPGGMAIAAPMAAMAKMMGYASAAAIAGQTVASFEGGGMTFSGVRSGGMDGKGGRLAMVHPNEKITDMEKGGGPAQPVNVNINISAVDAKGVDELLVKRRGMITNLVRSSLANSGSRLG